MESINQLIFLDFAMSDKQTVFDAGQATLAHLGDVVPDEQRSAAEIGPVSNHSPPHRGASHRSKTCRRDLVLQLRDQPGPR